MSLRAAASCIWSELLGVSKELWEVKGAAGAQWLLWAPLSAGGLFLSITLKPATA